MCRIGLTCGASQFLLECADRLIFFQRRVQQQCIALFFPSQGFFRFFHFTKGVLIRSLGFLVLFVVEEDVLPCLEFLIQLNGQQTLCLPVFHFNVGLPAIQQMLVCTQEIGFLFPKLIAFMCFEGAHLAGKGAAEGFQLTISFCFHL
ncbi:hypothetical protein SDC9_113424 [bioreactor metagenome]|uniref:Uncharacterized protein n=1 Tax=bioreactor metagenome TaxID=1076179 RepID=A0A645BMP2_9ZZZZ